MAKKLIWVLLAAVSLCAAADEAALRKALLFYASFDAGLDADVAQGDRKLYTATSYKDRGDAKPGLHHPDAGITAGKGKFGAALEFRKKNTKAVYFPAAGNMNFVNGRWQGTISFWLSLDPEVDLEPGFCDPIQVTAEAYNDAAIWVDFTKDEKPRHFRLGVFGNLKNWNPQNLASDKNPAFLNRLVVVKQTPFGRGKWTHVAIAHTGLGSGAGGQATLYLNGIKQGTTGMIPEAFSWDMTRAAIRLGVNYVGLFDELAVFSRPLTGDEVQLLYQMKKGLR
ncbi:MAG: hypothetical protein JJE04_08295 [Acidobacteriia bacterium]|nr:hypothetical protein [Terriglobia bacterium]